MNSKIKFLEIILSDLISNRDTYELELERILNEESSTINEKKVMFNDVLGKISENNNKIHIMSEFMSNINSEENNNNI